MSGVTLHEVNRDEAGLRLDRWFKRHYPTLGHGRLERLLRTGQVRLDGARVKASARLEEGQSIRVPPLPREGRPVEAEPRDQGALAKRDIQYVRSLVLHMDDEVIVINKPPGLPVQGGSKTGRHLDGLLQGLAYERKEKPRLVHRLDKDTSGVLVLARTAKAAAFLTKAFRGRDVRKIYWALTVGVPRYPTGTIDLPLHKTPVHRGGERVVVAPKGEESGRRAVSHYAVVEHAAQRFAWLALMPVTGRTHQLRVHCVAIGHPIVGDGKYGGAASHPGGELSGKLHLHAREVSFPHPAGGTVTVTAPLPPHMKESWELLGFDENFREDPFEELDEE